MNIIVAAKTAVKYLYKCKMQILQAICISFLLLFFSILGNQVAAQELESYDVQSIYGGPVLRTNGLGATFGMRKSSKQTTRVYQFDLVTHKHSRELKIVNQSIQNPRPYVFGKLYRTAIARANIGLEHPLIKRNDWNRLGMNANIMVGANLGMLRPVYLDIYYRRNNDVGDDIRSERYDPELHTYQEGIIGYSDKKRGWSDMEYRMGLNAQLAFDLQWTGDNGGYKALRIGGVLDYFPGGLPVMAFAENPSAPMTLFLAFIWGD